MGLDDLLISTGIDALIKLVRERGKIEMREAAQVLNVPEQSVEDWAHVLEGEGLVKIQYQLTQVMLVWTPLANDERDKKMRSVGERKTQTTRELESLAKNVSEGGVELSALETQLRSAQTHTQNRLQKLSADLAESDKLNAQLERTLTERQAGLAQMRQDLEAMRKEMEAFKSVAEQPGAKPTKDESAARAKKLAETESQLEERLKTTKQMFDSIQGELETIRTRLSADKTVEEMEELKHALEDLRFARAEMEKTSATILNETKMMGGELERIGSKLKLIETRKLEKTNPKKMLEQAEQLSARVQKEREAVLAGLEKSLSEVHGQVQAYTQAQYQFQTLSARMESMRTTVDRSMAQIGEMDQTLTKATKTYATDLGEARGQLAEEKAEYEQMAKRAKEVEETLNHLEDMRKRGEQLEIKLHGLIQEAQVFASSQAAAAPAPGSGSSGAGHGRKPQAGAGRAAAAPAASASQTIQMPAELASRIALTTQEEEDFEKKRQELALLVKKMWEDDRKPKSG